MANHILASEQGTDNHPDQLSHDRTHQVSEPATQKLANQFKILHENHFLPCNIGNLRYLIKQGYEMYYQHHAEEIDGYSRYSQPNVKEIGEYKTYEQQFADYAARDYVQQGDILDTVTYGIARMIEIGLESLLCIDASPKHTLFFAGLEEFLGRQAADALLDQAKRAA